MTLGPIREKIDVLDQRIVDLVNERLALASEIGRIKRSTGGEIYVPEREEVVVGKVCASNRGPIKNEALRAIYREIMSAAIALEKPLLVAYLGPEATNTHAAAMKKFGASVDYHAMATIADIFTAVEKGRGRRGRDPHREFHGGQRARDPGQLCRERPQDRRPDLSRDHPRADRPLPAGKDQAGPLEGPGAGPVPPLAAAPPAARAAGGRAEHLAGRADRPGRSAGGGVAGELAADYYGVPVRRPEYPGQGRQHDPVFRAGPETGRARRWREGHDELSVSLGDEAASHSGALLKMLMPLAERGINLSKIESRPSKKRPWDYYFFLDVTGHYEDVRHEGRAGRTEEVLPGGEVARQLSDRDRGVAQPRKGQSLKNSRKKTAATA